MQPFQLYIALRGLWCVPLSPSSPSVAASDGSVVAIAPVRYAIASVLSKWLGGASRRGRALPLLAVRLRFVFCFLKIVGGACLARPALRDARLEA